MTLKNKILAHFGKERNNNWLFFFRISVAAFCLLHFLALFPDLKSILSNNSFILPDIVDAYTTHISPTIYALNNFLEKHLHVSYSVYALASVYITALIFLMLGFFSRISAIVAALCHLTIISSIDFFAYGVDFFCTIALFYCIIFPVGRYYALSNLFRRKRRANDAIYANICLKILQVHVCIIYFFSGFDKILGFNWWNGESIWKAIHLSYNPSLVNVDSLSNTPVFLIIGWTTIVLEMLYPIFINIRKTRKIWIFAVVGLHLSIALFLGLFFFSTFMIILNLSAFYVPYMSRVDTREFIRKSFGAENTLQILYDSKCAFCNAFIVKLSELDVNSGNYIAYDLRDAEARRLLKNHDVQFVNLNTIYCLYNGEVLTKSKAIFHVLSFAKKPFCYLSWFARLPRTLTDCVYSRIARNRYVLSRFF